MNDLGNLETVTYLCIFNGTEFKEDFETVNCVYSHCICPLTGRNLLVVEWSRGNLQPGPNSIVMIIHKDHRSEVSGWLYTGIKSERGWQEGGVDGTGAFGHKGSCFKS